MIVRILGEGQYDVAETHLDRLNELDAAVEAAVSAGDTVSFTAALGALLDGHPWVTTGACAEGRIRWRRAAAAAVRTAASARTRRS